MNNLEAIEKWKTWTEENENFAGDVTPADGPKVDFWFANNGVKANAFFHCFATGGDGSLIAVYSAKGGSFEKGPVVHLGHEGEIFQIASDVPHALALFAASGDSYEQALTDDEETALDDEMGKWLKKTFDLKVPKSVVTAVKAANAEGAAVKKHIEKLNG